MGFYIDMINVGQGDSFLLSLDDPDRGVYYILVDGGPKSTVEHLVTHLKSITSGTINAVIATHLDCDHIGGLPDVIENLSVKCLLINVPGNLDNWLKARDAFKRLGEKVESARKLVENLSYTESLLNVATRKKVNVEPLLAGRNWSHGQDITINILNPTEDRLKAAWADEILKGVVEGKVFEEAKAPETSNSNNASVILELGYKQEPYAIFTGDAGAAVIKEVIGGRKYQFLKIPHHGSKTGLDEELVKIINPSKGYLSVGDNPHGHPATEVLDILKKVNCQTFCTNRTKYCKRECSYQGFGDLCHRHDKPSRPGWSLVNAENCLNNK